MKQETITLGESSVFRLQIVNGKGEPTGEYLEFDLEDIEMPLRINDADKKHIANMNWVKSQYAILDKKQDKKGKYLMSWKEEEQIKILREFFNKEMEALDMFLGENGCKKLLAGRKPYLTMYDDIEKALEQVMPYFKKNSVSIIDKIKSKYSEKEENTLE